MLKRLSQSTCILGMKAGAAVTKGATLGTELHSPLDPRAPLRTKLSRDNVIDR